MSRESVFGHMGNSFACFPETSALKTSLYSGVAGKNNLQHKTESVFRYFSEEQLHPLT